MTCIRFAAVLIVLLTACDGSGSRRPAEPAPLANFGGSGDGTQLPPDTLPAPLPDLPPDVQPTVGYDLTPYRDRATGGVLTIPVPQRETIAGWLVGQRIRAYRRLFDSVWWTIEPGEVTEMQTSPQGLDPEGRSWIVGLDFRVQDGDGKGLRIQGVLRHDWQGTEAGDVTFRDFTPTHVERFGSW